MGGEAESTDQFFSELLDAGTPRRMATTSPPPTGAPVASMAAAGAPPHSAEMRRMDSGAAFTQQQRAQSQQQLAQQEQQLLATRCDNAVAQAQALERERDQLRLDAMAGSTHEQLYQQSLQERRLLQERVAQLEGRVADDRAVFHEAPRRETVLPGHQHRGVGGAHHVHDRRLGGEFPRQRIGQQGHRTLHLGMAGALGDGEVVEGGQEGVAHGAEPRPGVGQGPAPGGRADPRLSSRGR